LLAIQSLPHYIKCCATVVVLVHDECDADERYTFDAWAQGGWCRLERMVATMPFATRKLNSRGEAIGTLIECDNRIVVSVRDVKGDVPVLRAGELEDTSPRTFPPLDGNFGDDEDIMIPEDQRDRKKARVLAEYLLAFLDEEDKRRATEEHSMRDAEKRFDEAAYMQRDEGEGIEHNGDADTCGDASNHESKTEDGTWQVRAFVEADEANREAEAKKSASNHESKTEDGTWQVRAFVEADEANREAEAKKSDDTGGDGDSVDATSVSLTTWSSFGNDYGSHLPSIQSNGGARSIPHSSEYSTTFGQTIGSIQNAFY